MRIEIKLNENSYAIDVDGNCFTAIKVVAGAETDKQGNASKNAGVLKDVQLGYFNKLSSAALRLCREEIAQSDEVISLKEFATRVEANNKQLLDQLELLPV